MAADVRRLTQRVELAMQRQNERDVLGDAQRLRRDHDALLAETLDLVDQRLGIEHDAVADHRQFAGTQHAGRQQRELVGLAVDDERVAGIVAALEADDDVGLLRQPVDDLAFSFVAPLGADDNNIGHGRCGFLREIRTSDATRSPGVLTGPVRDIRSMSAVLHGIDEAPAGRKQNGP